MDPLYINQLLDEDYMYIKKALLLITLILLTSFLSAQTTCDPDDDIYLDLSIWESRGYIEKLPPLRPYPVKLIISLLKDITVSAEGRDLEKAEEYLEKLDQSYSGSLKLKHSSRISDSLYYGETGINGGLEGTPSPNLSLSGDMNLFLIDQGDSDVLPAYSRPNQDKLPDWSDIDLLGKNYKVQQGLSALTAFSGESCYFQAGLVRNSFGPFHGDSAVLSSNAPQTGHFSFTWMQDSFTFTTALLELTATDDYGEDTFTEKYLSLHSVFFYPAPWLEAGIFETVVYGGRLEPMYMLPMSEFFYSQGYLGFPDNSLIGLSAKFKLPENIGYSILLYADDLHFNDMIRFDFDTKYKLALQTGFAWTPEKSRIRRLSIDYLIVTPYMYTHKNSEDETDPNYQNYTHQGVNLGPDLDPNSDRITLTLLLTPAEKVDLEFTGRYIRHGNGSVDGSVNVGDGDGSIFDDGYDDDGECTFQDTTRFLRQDIIERIFQIGIQGKTVFRSGENLITGTAGYTLEYVNNKDLTSTDEWNHYFNIGAGISF